MSKFIDQVQAYDTRKRYAAVGPVSMTYKAQLDDFADIGHYEEYRVEVRIGGSFKIRDRETSEELEQAKRVLTRSIQENVFGEFRKPLYDLECYLYDMDIDKAKECLNNLRLQMFSV